MTVIVMTHTLRLARWDSGSYILAYIIMKSLFWKKAELQVIS
jgi:hypothetical protein